MASNGTQYYSGGSSFSTSWRFACDCKRFEEAGFKKTGRDARFSLVARYCEYHACGWVRPKDWTDYCVEKLDTMGEKP